MKKISILLLILGISSCSIWENRTKNLINKELTLIVDNKKENQSIPYIIIKGDGRVSGMTGCNRLLANAIFESSGKIKFQNIAITKMFCNDSNELETDFLNALDNTHYYSIEEKTTVHFIDKNQEVLISFIMR